MERTKLKYGCNPHQPYAALEALSGGRSPGRGHSPRSSRATMIWPAISPGVRLRTSIWVPVWQKVQASVQPTWDETQSVPRFSSGM